MATSDQISKISGSPRFVVMQHREGVSVTMNIYPGEGDIETVMTAYKALVTAVASVPGYAYNEPEDGDSDFVPSRRSGGFLRRKKRSNKHEP